MSLPKLEVFIPGGTQFRHLGESAHRYKDLVAVEGWYGLTLHANGYWGSVLCIIVAESNDNWTAWTGFTKGESHVGEEFWYGLHIYPYNLNRYLTRGGNGHEDLHPNRAAAAIAVAFNKEEVSS